MECLRSFTVAYGRLRSLTVVYDGYQEEDKDKDKNENKDKDKEENKNKDKEENKDKKENKDFLYCRV